MRKQDSSRIKIGDELTVKQRQWYYVGSGEAVKTVKVLEVITEGDGALPLFKVKLPSGKTSLLTHKFFEGKKKAVKRIRLSGNYVTVPLNITNEEEE